MSTPFNDPTNKDGVIQSYERGMGFPDGFVSGDNLRLKQAVADANLALDAVFGIIFEVASSSNPDDTNHEDYPIQFFNIISGQRDYSFVNDEDGNQITDVLKVAIKDMNGVFRELPSVDQEARNSNNIDVSSFIDGRNTAGTPTRYDRTATGIFFDPIPNYNSSQGGKVFIYREGSYFTTASTDKKPGFCGLYHEFIPLHMSYRNARGHTLEAREAFKRDLGEMEAKIRKYYGRKDRDVVRRIIPNIHNCR